MIFAKVLYSISFLPKYSPLMTFIKTYKIIDIIQYNKCVLGEIKMININNYNKINRWWGADSVSAARKVDKLTGKTQKESTCNKLENLLEDHRKIGITVIKALIGFKQARNDSWFCTGRANQNDHLDTIANELRQLNLPDMSKDKYPTLRELEVLVKNSSYFVQRDIPTHFKNFIINLSSSDKKEIIDEHNRDFLQSNDIIKKVFTIEWDSNRFIIKNIDDKELATVFYSAAGNVNITIDLLDKTIQLNDNFLIQDGYTKKVYTDGDERSINYTLTNQDKLSQQFEKIGDNVKKLFSFEGRLTSKDNQNPSISGGYDYYQLDEDC